MPTLSTPNPFGVLAISGDFPSASAGFMDLILNKEEAKDFVSTIQSKPTLFVLGVVTEKGL
jgi:hypothetical protein